VHEPAAPFPARVDHQALLALGVVAQHITENINKEIITTARQMQGDLDLAEAHKRMDCHHYMALSTIMSEVQCTIQDNFFSPQPTTFVPINQNDIPLSFDDLIASPFFFVILNNKGFDVTMCQNSRADPLVQYRPMQPRIHGLPRGATVFPGGRVQLPQHAFPPYNRAGVQLRIHFGPPVDERDLEAGWVLYKRTA
jgi:hypothetical protein